MNNSEILKSILKKAQEKKGFTFNKDTDHTNNVIEGLLTNKDRYGYISCPCRLASGNKEEDQSIICPCDYRDYDVKTYGTCYCKLFVNNEEKNRDLSNISVPDRHLTKD